MLEGKWSWNMNQHSYGIPELVRGELVNSAITQKVRKAND